MKRFLNLAIAAALTLSMSLGAAFGPSPLSFLEPGGGMAQAQVLGTNRPQIRDRLLAVLTPTATQTFAVTTYADLVGSSVSFTPSVDPTQAVFPGGTNLNPVYVRVVATLDVSKATATTGSCTPFVNGAVIAAMETFIASAAGRGTMVLDFTIPITSAATQTLKIQCRSADTNIFTVTDSSVTWTELF